MHNFWRRGLTPKQWQGWKTYLKFIPLPSDRIDFQFAMLRSEQFAFKGASIGPEKLIPPYGKVVRAKTEEELEAKAKAYVERRGGQWQSTSQK